MVAEGAVDLGFTRLPSPTPGLREEHVMPTRNICVLHKSHPLAGNSKIDVEQLKTENLILLNRERAVRHELEAIFYRAGLRRRPPSKRIPSAAAAHLPQKVLALQSSASCWRSSIGLYHWHSFRWNRPFPSITPSSVPNSRHFRKSLCRS